MNEAVMKTEKDHEIAMGVKEEGKAQVVIDETVQGREDTAKIN